MNSCTTIIVIIIQINKSDVLFYNGVGKPPYCEVAFKAVDNDSTPPDLTITISFPTITFTISRVAETTHDRGVAVKKYQYSIDLCKYNYFNLLYQLKLMLALLLQVQLQTLS